jgi:hypothetical protein
VPELLHLSEDFRSFSQFTFINYFMPSFGFTFSASLSMIHRFGLSMLSHVFHFPFKFFFSLPLPACSNTFTLSSNHGITFLI